MPGYAFVRQSDQSDCGAAALACVAMHYGLPIRLQQMRDLTGTDKIGTNLWELAQAAERLGFKAKGVQGAFEHLSGIELPAIAHVRSDEGYGHFVVVHAVKRNGAVVVANPAHQSVETLSREAFCGCWSGYLLLLAPEQTLSRPEGIDAPQSVARRFLGLLSGHGTLVAEAVLLALLMTVLGVASSYFVQHLVDNVLVRGEHRLLNALGIGMLLVIAFRTAFSALRQYLLAFAGRQVDLALVGGYLRHVLHLPMHFFDVRRTGDILARVHDAQAVRQAINGAALSTVVDGLLVVVSLALLWCYDWPLALVATLFVPLLLAAVVSFHPLVKRKTRQVQERSARLASHLIEDVTGAETVKSCTAERLRAEEGESHLVAVSHVAFSLQKAGIAMATSGLLVNAAAGLAVLWYGGVRVMDGAITIGELMFFYSMLNYLLGPLERLASVNLELQNALTAADRLFQFLDVNSEQRGDGAKLPFTGIREGVTLDAVSFRYGRRGDVLEQVSLRIPAGRTVAVVGESGSGKTTLIKLLQGLYRPTAGRLTIDGLDLEDFDLPSLRGRIGVVSQEPFIFNGTLRDNVVFGCPQASLEEVIRAVRLAGLEDFVTALPERYDTPLGERGMNLSGGQRQRLAIARALLRQPDLLIFDEATSHLDTATERAIQQSLKGQLAGKTVVLVAHRLSTVKEADLIYVLHEGRVVQSGTHDELAAQPGWYRSLWQAQTGEREMSGLPELAMALTARPNGEALKPKETPQRV